MFTGTEKRLFCSLQLPFVFEAVITVPPCLFFSLTRFFQVFFHNCLLIYLNRIFIFSSCYCWFFSGKVSMQVGDPRPIVLWLIILLSAKYLLSLIQNQISQKICSVHLLVFTGKQPPGCVYHWALHLLCNTFTRITFPYLAYENANQEQQQNTPCLATDCVSSLPKSHYVFSKEVYFCCSL